MIGFSKSKGPSKYARRAYFELVAPKATSSKLNPIPNQNGHDLGHGLVANRHDLSSVGHLYARKIVYFLWDSIQIKPK